MDWCVDDVAARQFDGYGGAICIESVPWDKPLAGDGIGMREVGDTKGAFIVCDEIIGGLTQIDAPLSTMRGVAVGVVAL